MLPQLSAFAVPCTALLSNMLNYCLWTEWMSWWTDETGDREAEVPFLELHLQSCCYSSSRQEPSLAFEPLLSAVVWVCFWNQFLHKVKITCWSFTVRTIQWYLLTEMILLHYWWHFVPVWYVIAQNNVNDLYWIYIFPFSVIFIMSYV